MSSDISLRSAPLGTFAPPMPTILISHILVMADALPWIITRISHLFNTVQRQTYAQLLPLFVANPRFDFCTQGLSKKSIREMRSDQHFNKIKEIHHLVIEGAKETGIIPFSGRKRRSPLGFFNELNKLAKKIQEIRDEDLFIFHEFLIDHLIQNNIIEKIDLPNCLDPKNQATLIRKWMNNNRDSLSQVQEIDLSETGLRTVPPETALCKNIETFYLQKNRLTIIKASHAFKKLKTLILKRNKIRRIDDLGKLTNLSVFHACHNQLKKINGLSKLKKLTELCFESNKIKKMPLGIETLPKLKKVYFQKNPLSYEA